MRTAIRGLRSMLWLPLCGAIALGGPVRALDAPGPLDELDDADRKALETIAGNSAELRDAILKASLYVDTLVETQRIQEQSSASFQERIAKLDKKQQEQVWEIVSEPGLLDELATEKPPTVAQLDAIAKRHPEKLAPAIRALGAKQHDLFTDVARIHRQASDRFEARMADLPEDTQRAFRDLLGKPELLSVAVSRVRLMVRLGDSYRADPDGTRRYLSELSSEVAKSNETAQKEWVETLEKDPKAAGEFEQSAREYSEENGYDYDELTNPEVRTRVTVVVNPYPYWFGYPAWYSNFYLYPYGYWYPYPAYFGYYYYGPQFVWWGLPSIAFTNWFFVGHHHHNYAYLSNRFNQHYYSHPHARDSFHNTVGNWAAWRAVGQQRGSGRGDWTSASWERPAGRVGAGGLGARDSGAFFNRNQPTDRWSREGGWSRGNGRSGGDSRFRDGIDRVAPGERGPSIGDGLDGRGRDRSVRVNPPSVQPDAGAMPIIRSGERGEGVRSSRARGRDGIAARQQQPTPVFETPQVTPQPQQERGAVPDSGRGFRGDRGRRDQPRFQAPTSPAPQPPAAQQETSPSGRDPGEGRGRRGDGRGRGDANPGFSARGARDSGGVGFQGGGAPRGSSGGRGGGGSIGGQGGGGFGMRGGGDFGGRGGGGFGAGGGRPSGRGR